MSERAIKFEYLVTKVQEVCLEAEAMKVANKACELEGSFPIYGESDFMVKAGRLGELANAILNL